MLSSRSRRPAHGQPADPEPLTECRDDHDPGAAHCLRPHKVPGCQYIWDSHRHGNAVCPLPSALVNSLAVVLLPSTARHQSAGNTSGIADGSPCPSATASTSGSSASGVFTVFGETLGLQIFKSQDAGSFIQILAWLCPFLYLATSSGSILNGLGRTKLTFFHHLVSLLVRIAFVVVRDPGVRDPFLSLGMLASEVLLALLHILALRRITAFEWNAWILIGKPVFCLLCALWIFRLFPEDFPIPSGFPEFFRTAVRILILSAAYFLLLLFFHRKPQRSAA